ncbi:MAG: hypothetical protein FWG75_10560 [Cystobacterineae bacterium]|nr:hypothetical protein [Cystobacterineae bacterium]
MRKQRGFVLLLVLGIVVGLTLAVMFTMLSIQKHSNIQGMSKRQKMAQYAAEAALAEGREIFRLAIEHEAEKGNLKVSDVLSNFPVVEDFRDLRPWHDLFCRGTQECNRWAPFHFVEDKTVSKAELNSKFGKLDAKDLWSGRIRYRAFAYVYTDELLSSRITDSPHIVLVGLGEVGAEGQPPYRIYTRATVSYSSDEKAPALAGGATHKGGEGNAFVER